MLGSKSHSEALFCTLSLPPAKIKAPPKRRGFCYAANFYAANLFLLFLLLLAHAFCNHKRRLGGGQNHTR
ncbi:MAG: hypothetical protein IJP01_01270, partial [Oscillospiraceae bacterium]|nr:hypothetical protein [Oscillospiraceae bacterium]